MEIRNYLTGDLDEILELFYQTVHVINAADYTPEQLNAWADGKPDRDVWGKSLLEHRTLVAVCDGKIAGFADMTADGYLDRMYVHKDYQNRGIAAALLKRLEDGCHTGKFVTHASITARPFFEKKGYHVVKSQQVERKGQMLMNYVMEKEKERVKIPTLQTERLYLRPLVPEDADEAFANWTHDAEVAKYMRWSVHQNVEETREWLIGEQEGSQTGNIYDWGFVLKETGELIGSGGLSYSEEQGMFELGYNIMKKYWNQGYTTEAAKRIVDFAVSELGEKKLHCCHAKDNPASGRVMEKAGFTYVRDSSYASFDGKRQFACKEYILDLEKGEDNCEDK